MGGRNMRVSREWLSGNSSAGNERIPGYDQYFVLRRGPGESQDLSKCGCPGEDLSCANPNNNRQPSASRRNRRTVQPGPVIEGLANS
jgi:hypothetical protein